MANVKRSTDVSSTVEQLLNAPYGIQGADIISSTDPQKGSWYCIIAIADNSQLDVSGVTVNWTENGLALSTDLDLITGLPYYGDFTQLELTGGKIIAYKK